MFKNNEADFRFQSKWYECRKEVHIQDLEIMQTIYHLKQYQINSY